MTSSIGPLIRRTRELAELTTEVLAQRARVDSRELAKLERGEPANLSTVDIAELARELGVDDMDWYGGRDTAPTRLLFRRQGMPDFYADDLPLLDEALRQARAVAAVDAILGTSSLRPRFQDEPLPPNLKPFDHGYALAIRVRAVLGQPTQPLGDMQLLIEDRFGVPVLDRALRKQEIFAFTVKERTGLAAVVFNTEAAARPLRRRVDLAHELAHVLFDAPRDSADCFVDRIEPDPRDDESPEQRARAFAAELLLPAAGLQDLLGEPRGLTELADALPLFQLARQTFQTSAELAANHLVNRGYISRTLREDLPRLAGPFMETQSPPPQQPLLHRRVTQALDAGRISQMRARELLDLSAWDDLPAPLRPAR